MYVCHDSFSRAPSPCTHTRPGTLHAIQTRILMCERVCVTPSHQLWMVLCACVAAPHPATRRAHTPSRDDLVVIHHHVMIWLCMPIHSHYDDDLVVPAAPAMPPPMPPSLRDDIAFCRLATSASVSSTASAADGGCPPITSLLKVVALRAYLLNDTQVRVRGEMMGSPQYILWDRQNIET
eukprot:COSAG01_NODE_5909_length_3955_cov_4.622280_3_plen_180_part_00